MAESFAEVRAAQSASIAASVLFERVRGPTQRDGRSRESEL